MRLVLFVLILGTTLLAAAQNDDARARLRGSRRFALTSPGLAASRRAPRVEGETQAVELDAREPETSASPQSSTRGTQLLRRGRPGIGTRTDSQVVSQSPAEVVAEEGPVSRPVPNPNRADGLRVRRPLKLPATTTSATTTTTTTTTTTEASVSESVVTEKTGAEIQQAVMMEEKILENEAQPIEEPEMAKALPAEEVAEVPKPAEKSKSLPKPKLRPIPIKVGQRKESKSDLKEAPAESEPPNDQEQTPSVTDAVSSHRFSSRPRPTTRIESRGRPRGTRPTSDQPAEQQIAAEEPKPATARTGGSRSRLFAAREGRTPSRRITSTQTRAGETPIENTAELSRKPPVLRTQFIEDTAEEKVTQARPQRRWPALNRKPADEVVEDIRPRQNKRIQPRPESKPVADVSTYDGFHAKMPPPPMIAPEAQTPRPGFPIPNYGGTDLVFRAGEVQMTQIGTAEDTPLEETRRILSGLGSRRRGLGRPIDSAQLKTIDAQIGQGKSPPLSSVPVDNEHAAAENNDPLAQDYIYDYEYV